MRSESLVDQIEVWGFESDAVVFRDGSLGFGLALTTLDSSCWSDEQSTEFGQKSRQFLNGLPSGINLQFVLDIGAGNNAILSRHKELGNKGLEIARELAATRVGRYSQLEKDGLLPTHVLRIFVRRPLSAPLVAKKHFSPKHFQTISEKRLDDELASLEKLRSDIIQSLASLGIVATKLTATDLAALFYHQWNPSRDIPTPSYNSEDIRSDLLFTDIRIYDQGFSMADMHHRVISLKRLPDRTYATMAAQLSELPFGSRLLVNVETLDQEKELSRLQLQRRLAFAMSRGKSGISDIDSESKFQDLESLIEQMIAQGEKVYKMSLNILLRSHVIGKPASTASASIDAMVSESLLTLREMAGAEGMLETIASFDVFLESSVPNSRGAERSKWIEHPILRTFYPCLLPGWGTTPRWFCFGRGKGA